MKEDWVDRVLTLVGRGCVTTIVLLVVLSVGSSVRGQEQCVVQTYAAPPWLAEVADPNAVPLPPDPTAPDSNDWSEPLGKFNRPYALACDPNDDDFEIELVGWSGENRPAIFHDKANGRWSMSADTEPGYNWVTVLARDEHGAEQLYGVYWRGRDEDNAPPVLR